MEITCPSCGKRGRLDDARIPDGGILARCPGCQAKLWLNKVDGVSLAEESPAPPTPEAPPAEPAPPPAPPAPEAPPAPTPPEPPAPGMQAAAGAAAGTTLGFQDPPAPPETPAAPPAAETADAPTLPCKVCGNTYPSTEMVRFGNTMVCATCKPGYVQSMRSGVPRTAGLRYGGFWIRFVAKFVDGIILGIVQAVVIVPLAMVMFRTALENPSALDAAIAPYQAVANLISIVFGAAYTCFFIGKFRATPGKMIFKLQVVMPDGGRVSYMRALGRHFAEWISAIILGIGYIMAAFDGQKRTLHDRICSTRVAYK